jgi:hypothetical protein
MNESRADSEAIRQFVRESLGCGCPDEVFDNVRVTARSDILELAPAVYEIGGRLVIAVFDAQDWHAIGSNLRSIVETGRHYRDRHGYNRFRLVVVTDDDEARKQLASLFDALPNTDARTHLHLIKPTDLPDHARI